MENTTQRVIPIQEFFSNPVRTNFDISQDGSMISWLAPWIPDVNNNSDNIVDGIDSGGQSRMNVFVQQRETHEIRQITFETDRDIAGYVWANDKQILFIRDDGGDENYHIYSAYVDGSKDVQDLTPFPGVKCGVVDMLRDDDEHILINMNKNNPALFDVYRLNIVSGEMTLIAQNPGNVIGWLTDRNGKLRVAIGGDGVNRSLLYRPTEEAEFKEIVTTNFRDSLNPMGFDYHSEVLYVCSNRGRNTAAIYKFDPQTGKETELIYQNNEFDCESLAFSHKRKCMTYVTYTSWKDEFVFFDESTKNLYTRLHELIERGDIRITAHDKEEETFIVYAMGDTLPGSYYVYHQPSDKLELLAHVRPSLKSEELCKMNPIHYTTRDGLTIHGYLTLPVGYSLEDNSAKNLPMIIHPHGGPWVRDEWRYNPLVQFLANRGYAVLQMNYRGSTGYGRDFWTASFKQWGRAMQDDITDGVRWLVDTGVADPKRVAILGGSYGGYAVLAGLAFTPDLYTCGVDIVGVSNLFTFRKTIPAYWKPLDEMSNEMIGDPVADKELLTAVSPVFHVDKITAPLLVFQGAKDPRVNIEESNQIVSALRSRGVDVEYIVKEDEGHGFNNEENKMEMYSIIEKFLSTYL